MDSLAFIGHNPGHNGKNPWQDLYDPSRRIQPDTTTQGDEASPSFSSSSESQTL